MSANRRLKILAVAHLALGVVTAVLAKVELSTPVELRDILIVPLFALALCQSFLLSLWAAASRAPPWKRLAGLVAGAVYLEALLATKFERGVSGDRRHHDCGDHGVLARGAVAGG